MYHRVENFTYTIRCLEQCGDNISKLEITNNFKSSKLDGVEILPF
jgi:hypothetical protein